MEYDLKQNDRVKHFFPGIFLSLRNLKFLYYYILNFKLFLF